MSIGVTRRQAITGLCATGLPVLGARSAYADLAPLEQAARKDGSLTWYVAQMSGEAAEAMGHSFTAQYPGVSVSVVRTTGQVAYQRIQQELKNNAPQCDVFSTTDIAHMPALHAQGALANYVPQSAGELAPAFVGLGEPGFYYATTVSLQILVYQTISVPPADVPRNWTDLIDPKWRNHVAVAHPAFSGNFGQWVLAMRKLYGWQYFERLAQNKPRIGRSGNDPLTMLNAGESLIGTGPVSTTVQNIDKGNHVNFIYPTDGTLLCVGPSAVLAQAPRPNAARLFMEWLLSADYARAGAKWHLEAVRADAPPLPGTKPLADLNLLHLTTDEIAKGVPEVIEQWRDTFGS